jgi:hypothetical protein
MYSTGYMNPTFTKLQLLHNLIWKSLKLNSIKIGEKVSALILRHGQRDMTSHTEYMKYLKAWESFYYSSCDIGQHTAKVSVISFLPPAPWTQHLQSRARLTELLLVTGKLIFLRWENTLRPRSSPFSPLSVLLTWGRRQSHISKHCLHNLNYRQIGLNVEKKTFPASARNRIRTPK